MPAKLGNGRGTAWLLFWFLAAALPVSETVFGNDAEGWWQADWKQRMTVSVPENSGQELRISFPPGVRSAAIRCVVAGEKQPLEHWSQTLEFSPRKFVAKSRDAHYGFPRLVRAANGDYFVDSSAERTAS